MDDISAIEEGGIFFIVLGPGHRQGFGSSRENRDAAFAALMNEPACRECGRHFEKTYCEPTRSQMISRQLCFGCNFWTDIVSERTRFVLIDGRSYQIEKVSRRPAAGMASAVENSQSSFSMVAWSGQGTFGAKAKYRHISETDFLIPRFSLSDQSQLGIDKDI